VTIQQNKTAFQEAEATLVQCVKTINEFDEAFNAILEQEKQAMQGDDNEIA
jgi:hypothetical protein